MSPSTARSGSAGSPRPVRNRRRKGSEILEFTFALLPLLAMMSVLLDTAWAVYAQATIQRAVRLAVRQGITLTNSQMAQNADLTGTVKGTVQQNAFGFLNGSSGLGYIKVHYYLPPDAGSTADATDVSTRSDGNKAGNIMEVSVQNLQIRPLLPQIFTWKDVEFNFQTINAEAADVIEPSNDRPPIGTAP